ncbi:hypothetical protein ACNOYE_21940 [Nannocystaceae bacterium ST9]
MLISFALTGCAGVRPSELALARPAQARSVELASQGATLAMLARPSAEVAAFAGGDRYRVVFEGPSAITLVLLDPDDRPHARLRLRALDHSHATSAWSLDFEDLDADVEGRIEMWTLADRLHGSATIDERSASWRARLGDDGHLAAERWKVDTTHDTRGTSSLRRARAIGSDLGSLAAELDASLDSERSCRIVEAIANIELALDLALRAYEGRGRSELPVWISSRVAEGC